MAHPSDAQFLVLHALRLKGFADAAPVAAMAGIAEDDVRAELNRLVEEGLATRRDGRISGWTLTPAGRTRHTEMIAAELAASGARETVEAGYLDFLAANQDMLSICTDWQMRTVGASQVPNDHSDATYDKEVVSRLRGIDEAVQPVCGRLAGAMDRFSGYGPRLRTALEKVEAGDNQWFTKPLIDSYHTVWFELHEDLLATLAIERSKEACP